MQVPRIQPDVPQWESTYPALHAWAQVGGALTDIHLSKSIKSVYSEIVPVLSGQDNNAAITLFGRRRDNPEQLDKIVTRPWTEGAPIKIVWDEAPVPSTE